MLASPAIIQETPIRHCSGAARNRITQQGNATLYTVMIRGTENITCNAFNKKIHRVTKHKIGHHM